MNNANRLRIPPPQHCTSQQELRTWLKHKQVEAEMARRSERTTAAIKLLRLVRSEGP